MEKLAIDGGTPVRTAPLGQGRRYTGEERRQLLEALDSGRLSYWSKYKVSEFCETVKNYFKIGYCAGGSSGSAAIHAAIAALEIEPGGEVITSPITDMGSLIGILYQNLIPVFADVDPASYNITAESIARVTTPETRAIMPVHLAGTPCDMDAIMAFAAERGIPVVEDCAQAYSAVYKGRFAGTIGDIGAFSLNESKHLSCGEGGFAITDSEELYVKLHNYFDKYYDRLGRGNRLNALAPCYRLSEMQYAVANAQFAKLDGIIAARRRIAARLTRGIEGLPGILPPAVPGASESSWWFYQFRIDPKLTKVDNVRFAELLRAEGIPASAGYIARPVYLENLFVNKSFFPGGIWPAEVVSGKTRQYHEGLCPNAETVLKSTIRLPVSEFFTDADADDMVAAVRKVHRAVHGI